MEPPMTGHLALLAACWIAYFGLHSALASLGLKHHVAARWPAAMPAYRLAYNALALVLLAPPVGLMLTWQGPLLWAWTGPWAWVSHALALLALGLFVWSLGAYDNGEFSGLRQWRERTRTVEDQETLRLSPLHRYVRHPWYFCALLLIWTRDMDAARLLSALLASAYFVVGSRLEETKLVAYHGAAYATYRRRVAGLVPLPWRRLSAAEAAALEAEARAAHGLNGSTGADGAGTGD
jgi:protein-S-isoprenylcysteine O-methyltransferase Ste14